MLTSFDKELLLNAQRALLGEIPPSLRAASFDLSSDGQDWVARFEFDGNPSEEALECVSVALTNLFTSYPYNWKPRTYKEEMLAIPYPQKLQRLRLAAFLRNEDEWNSWTKVFDKIRKAT